MMNACLSFSESDREILDFGNVSRLENVNFSDTINLIAKTPSMLTLLGF